MELKRNEFFLTIIFWFLFIDEKQTFYYLGLSAKKDEKSIPQHNDNIAINKEIRSIFNNIAIIKEIRSIFMKTLKSSCYLKAPLTDLSKFLVARRKTARKAKFPNKTSISIYNYSQQTYIMRQITKSNVINDLCIIKTRHTTFASLQKKEERLMDKPHSSSIFVKTSILSKMNKVLYKFWINFGINTTG